MNPNTNAEYDPKPVFEPSDLVSHGEVSVRTENGGSSRLTDSQAYSS